MITGELTYRLIKILIFCGLAYWAGVRGHETLGWLILIVGVSIPEPDFSGRMRGDYTQIGPGEHQMRMHLNRAQMLWLARIAGDKLRDAAVVIRAFNRLNDADVQMSIKLVVKPANQPDFFDVTSENPIASIPRIEDGEFDE